MILDGLAQFMFGMGDAPLATVGLGAGSAGEKKETTQRSSSECGLAKQLLMRLLTQQHKRPPAGAALVLVGVLRVLAA
jgi:hypothetical protein